MYEIFETISGLICHRVRGHDRADRLVRTMNENEEFARSGKHYEYRFAL